MTPDIRINDFIDDLCEIASSPGSEGEQRAGIRDLLEELESELTAWAEAKGADMTEVSRFRADLRVRIVEEINTEGSSDRYRNALEYALGLLAMR